jgi:TonB family protein
MLLSDELNRVAGSVRLQASDVEWKTRNTSRAAWASGMQDFAESVGANQSTGMATAATAKVQLAEVPDEPVLLKKQAADVVDVIHDQAKSALTPLVPAESVEQIFMPVQERVAAGPVAQMPKPPVAQPTPVHTTFPKYPWRARTKGIEGFVELAFSLDRKGHVVDIELVDSLPAGIFDQAATRALQKWKFAESGGSDKPRRLLQKFDFTLEERISQAPLARNCVNAGHRACKRIPANAVVVYVNPPQETETLSRVN